MSEWRYVPGRDDYLVSSDGEVLSLSRRWRQPRVVRGALDRNGYHRVKVAGQRVFVHRLVAEAFLGPQPDGHEVAHLDGDRTNNRLSNLAWVTHTENMAHQKEHGTALLGERNPQSRYCEADVLRVLALSAQGLTDTQISGRTGVSRSTVQRMRTRRAWVHVQDPLYLEKE